jgi:hypothetical protein
VNQAIDGTSSNESFWETLANEKELYE